MTLSFTDTHTHIQGDEFSDDVDTVVQRATDAGVDRLIVPGVDVASSAAAIVLAEAHEGVYAAAGYHPHEAQLMDHGGFQAIEAMLPHRRVVAVGEIGLDYYYEHSSRQSQLECIERMLGLAEKHTMPVIVHCRDAWDDAAAVIEPWARRIRNNFADKPVGVMHYFSGTLEQARFYIDLGFLISVHTSVTHKKQTQMREVVAQLPLEALVIETDAPYGAPQVVRGQRNEPVQVVEAAKQIAIEQDIALEAVAATTSANAARLFGLPVPAGVAF